MLRVFVERFYIHSPASDSGFYKMTKTSQHSSRGSLGNVKDKQEADCRNSVSEPAAGVEKAPEERRLTLGLKTE